MKRTLSPVFRSWVTVLFTVLLCAPLVLAQQHALNKKILGGYFEEWSIYGAITTWPTFNKMALLTA